MTNKVICSQEEWYKQYKFLIDQIEFCLKETKGKSFNRNKWLEEMYQEYIEEFKDINLRIVKVLHTGYEEFLFQSVTITAGIEIVEVLNKHLTNKKSKVRFYLVHEDYVLNKT